MSKFKHGKYIKLIWIAGFVIVADQFTKAVIFYNLPAYQTVSVIPGFFNLTHIHNPGGAFGFLANMSNQVRDTFFLMASVLSIALIIYLHNKTPLTESRTCAAYSLILGGALGNLIDRIRLGVVVDFLDFYIGRLHWPAFNIADSAISIGIALFLFQYFFQKGAEPEELV